MPSVVPLPCETAGTRRAFARVARRMRSDLFLLSWAAFLRQKTDRNAGHAAASLSPVCRSRPLLRLPPASGVDVVIWLFHLEGLAAGQKETHRITEWRGLEGTSVGHPVQPPAQAGSPRAGCTGPCPGGSGISPEKGDSTASLGSLVQCSVTLRVKKFFLLFSWNFLCFNLCPLPLVLLLGTTEKSLVPSACMFLLCSGGLFIDCTSLTVSCVWLEKPLVLI